MSTAQTLWAAQTFAWDNGEGSEANLIGIFTTRKAATAAAKTALGDVSDWWYGSCAQIARLDVGVAYAAPSAPAATGEGNTVEWVDVASRGKHYRSF